METKKPAVSAKETILSFIRALNAEDFEAARAEVNDDLSFIGVMGTRNGAKAYFDDMQKMKFKYDVKKIFQDGNDVCIFYDIDMGKQTIFACGWYQLVNGKISTFRVVFDPRPLLEKDK
ncbi:MAG TPA: nuclear transport factor 2 family protein [Puia sp.]